MRQVRVAWAFLASAAGGFGLIAVYVASWPKYQFTSCEIDPWEYDETCDESLIDQGGPTYVAALLLPALLCFLPVLIPRRPVAWTTVGALTIGAVVVGITVGGVGMMLAATGVLAAALAAGHDRVAAHDLSPQPATRHLLLTRHQGHT